MKILAWPTSTGQKVFWGACAFLVVCLAVYLFIGKIQRDAAAMALAEKNRQDIIVKDAESEKLRLENLRLQKESEDLRQKNDADRAIAAERVAALLRSQVLRNQNADKKIYEIKAPKPVEDIAKDAQANLGISPPISNGVFQITAVQLQELIAVKVDRDRLTENVKDLMRQLELERQSSSSLRADLDRAIKSIADANARTEDQRLLKEEWKANAEQFRNVAKKTGWQKALAVGQEVGKIALTAVIVGYVAK